MEYGFASRIPLERADLSDTGELIAILGIDRRDVDAFADYYFNKEKNAVISQPGTTNNY